MEEKKKNRIYLDHAATTPLDERVFNEMRPYFTEIFGNADSPHSFGRGAMNALDLARDKVASLFGAKPEEIYFTSGGTESDNWAMTGGARAKKREGRTKVFYSAIEHHAVTENAKRLEREGFVCIPVPVDGTGVVDVEFLKENADENTALIAVMHANNELGTIEPVRKCADIAHAVGAYFFTDAVQSAPYLPLSVKEIGADFLSVSAHKFYGPKGSGVLYIGKGVRSEGLIVGGEQERGLRGGTLNVPNAVGFASAYGYCREEMAVNTAKIAKLKESFLSEILKTDGISVNGAPNPTGTVNLRIEGVSNETLLFKADLEGVALSAGSACASKSVKPSHVLKAIGLTDEQAKTCVRVSIGKNNTEEEIVRATRILKKAVEEIRR